MMINLLVTDELVIVGIRHGAFADKLKPLFDEEAPMEVTDLKKVIGTDVVSLSETYYDHDYNTIGVFATPKVRLGYLWANQAYAMKEWMDAHKVDRVRARITRVCTKYGFMVAKALKPMKLTIRPRESLFIYKDWAKEIPMLRPCWKGEQLERSMTVLEDCLAESDSWNEELAIMTEDVIEELSYDLSTRCFIRGVRLYLSMKDSAIREAREESDRLLYTMIHRGSPERMKWWLEHCLANYLLETRNDEALLKVYECANYTLERVEGLLHQAPGHLFPFYMGTKDKFASHLYYAALPHELYTRLLTLLAVREAMLEKKESENENVNDKIARSIETLRQEGELKHLYDITWVMIGMNASSELPSFDTPSSFLDYMVRLGVKKGLPSRSTISKYYDKAFGEYPNLTFTDADGNETKRRNNVIKRFLNLMKRE